MLWVKIPTGNVANWNRLFTQLPIYIDSDGTNSN
uniref:Uncharacterized protein n=1 Tax=Rhizophora mucronata TaxID=61149 RepID=A0A2P2Q2P9_RHIMU